MTSQSDSNVTRDWLVTFAHKVATERAYAALHPGHVFCLMLRRDEAEGLLQQVGELVCGPDFPVLESPREILAAPVVRERDTQTGDKSASASRKKGNDVR